ncbi:histone-fold-containing protein [Myxozyma melibiosi]|uniref:Histone-fold-containing protein n=1 Tax=Myxozyma melibiosi TaxID=54550 RepID=A0ABR1F428_9ASCO
MSLSPKQSPQDDTDDNIANILDMLETENQSGSSSAVHVYPPADVNGDSPSSGLIQNTDVTGSAQTAASHAIGDYEVKEQDKWLPIANVARIMKMALPDNAKISKEAKECMQECVSEFISFITSEASEKCSAEKRKTVNGEDILFAMTSLGFENYSETLKIYLAKYRQFIATRAGSK